MPTQQPQAIDSGIIGPTGILEVLAKANAVVADEHAELALDLPLPPSVNRTMGSRLGSKHPIVQEWQRAANAHLMMTRQNRRLRLLTGTVSVEIVWDTQNLADIDNRIKHLFDYLESINVVTNDIKIRSLHVSYGGVPAGCRVNLRQMDRQE